MAKARTTAATTVEEPIVEQNVETTAVVEEPQTVSDEPQTVSEEGDNTETTTENTVEGTTEEGTPQTPAEGDNDGTTAEPSLEDKFIEMTGINKPYADGIMKLPNADFYIPVGSSVNLDKRNKLIAEIKDKNNPTEGE